MRICFVDSSNFRDKPVGGQLTSIRSQLDYFRTLPDIRLCLVGIDFSGRNSLASSLASGGAGIDRVDDIPFAKVLSFNSDPDHPETSLRIAFMKGLLLNRNRIAALKPDVFFIHCPEAFLPLKILFPRKPIATFMHGSFFEIFEHTRFSRMKKPWIRATLDSYLKWVIKRSSGLFVLDKTSLEKSLPLNGNVWRVTNSIDLGRFQPSSELSDIHRIVFVGRLSANKRIDLMIEAVTNSPGFTLDIIGEGEEYQNLAEMIKKLGCKEYIQLLGSISMESIPALLVQYDVLLLNSVTEGMPMVILEAMASGLVIISTKVGAIGDMLTEAENCLFTDGTSDGIRNALMNLSALDARKIRENNLAKAHDYSHLTVNGEIMQHLSALTTRFKRSRRVMR
jgi:glycosyltransferase involved in cell wall biosynthesis